MHHIAMLETADDMGDGVGFADMGQKFVAQPFALGGARHQTGNIDKFDGGRNHRLRLDDGRQRLHTSIGNLHDAYIRIDSRRDNCLPGAWPR